MISSQYNETCEGLLEYQKIGGKERKYFIKEAIRNIMHANIDILSRSLISEFPVDGVKCISKLQQHCANMNFSGRSRHDRLFQKVTHKGGKYIINYIKRFQNTQAL